MVGCIKQLGKSGTMEVELIHVLDSIPLPVQGRAQSQRVEKVIDLLPMSGRRCGHATHRDVLFSSGSWRLGRYLRNVGRLGGYSPGEGL